MKFLIALILMITSKSDSQRNVGKLKEVFAWKQLTYNINEITLDRDRISADGFGIYTRNKRQYDSVYFKDDDHNYQPMENHNYNSSYGRLNYSNMINTNVQGTNENSDAFFIQYNNVPMGVERVGDRLFVTVPRRRYGIPSTLNYIDLSRDTGHELIIVVDFGWWTQDFWKYQQIRRPAIVVFDLVSDREILRYQLKESHIPANNTPAGLASITLDTSNGCSNTFAYIPDLTTFGIIVYSIRDNDSWRVTHNYMHFNPIAATLEIGGQRFQWNDGIFSISLGGSGRCKTAYFHPLISTQEFSVSTCVLNNITASNDTEYWTRYNIIGERGANTQSTMHDLHSSGVMFYAEVGRDGVSCWNTHDALDPRKVALLARDERRLSYPADLHVTDDEVWIMANSLPRFTYANLSTAEYNFFVYKANVQDLIADTVCDRRPQTSSYGNNYNNHGYF